jgi:hypothetical protein
MYLAAIILLMLVLPFASVAIEATLFVVPDPMALIGKWFTFWAVGARLFIAGLSQVFRPQFTSEGILGVKDEGANVLVREVGFGNLAIGALGVLSLVFPDFLLPAAIAGGLFYGLAGLGHIARKDKTAKEWIALASDFFIFLVLAAFVVSRATSW